MAKKKRDYACLGRGYGKRIAAPKLSYRPQDPKSYRPSIGLIGCGGITEAHLAAYRKARYSVAALCDIVPARARERRKQFYPEADVYTDHRKLLERDDIEVVDIATHPEVRPPIIADALRARKHVLSQKPFVLDLTVGRRLADLADRHGVKLAVNQNARWGAYLSYVRRAVSAGLIGRIIGAHFSMHWDHNWIRDTAFNKVRHIILYDFAIHFFDMLTCLMGGLRPKRVFASFTRAVSQEAKPPLLGQALIEYDGAQATAVFDGSAVYGAKNRTYLAGTDGTLISLGPNSSEQTVTLYTAKGHGSPRLKHDRRDGFHGAMGELLCAIEEDREPDTSGRRNLESLALCFAAVKSAERNLPVRPGTVKTLPGS